MIDANKALFVLIIINAADYVAVAYRLWRFHPDTWQSLGGTGFFSSVIGSNFLCRWRL
jgi:hypothetical protein